MKRRVKGLAAGLVIGFLGMGAIALMAGRLLAIDGTYSNLRLFNEVLSIIKSSYVDEVQSDALIKGAYDGMLAELDPFSEYLTAEEYAAYEKSSSSRNASQTPGRAPADVGMKVARRDGMALVVAVRPGSDAEARGITPGDLVRRIGDQPAREMSLFAIESLLAGRAGTSVTIHLSRREEPRKVEASFTRTEVMLPPVIFEMADSRDGIALMRVKHFTTGSAGQVATALEKAAKHRARRLLIDVRGNAWGSTDEAARALGAFAGSVVVGRLVGRSGTAKEITGGPRGVGFTGPIGILMDGATSDAAELFAAGLGDLSSAALMGETTFGVGAEQEILPLRTGGWLKLSTRRYASPSGVTWHGTGLKPAKILSVTTEGLSYPARKDRQLALALDYLKSISVEAGTHSRAGVTVPAAVGAAH